MVGVCLSILLFLNLHFTLIDYNYNSSLAYVIAHIHHMYDFIAIRELREADAVRKMKKQEEEEERKLKIIASSQDTKRR